MLSWFSLHLLSEKFLIIRRIEGDIITNVHIFSCKVPVILFKFSLNLNFLNSFSKNTQTPNSMKIRLVAAEFFRADGQTNATELIVAFCKFFESAKKHKFRLIPDTDTNTDTRYCFQKASVTKSIRRSTVNQLNVLWNPKTYNGVYKNPRTGAVLSQIKPRTFQLSRVFLSIIGPM